MPFRRTFLPNGIARVVGKVARLHLEKIGAKLTTLSPKQADYIGVPVEGPYKPDTYRY